MAITHGSSAITSAVPSFDRAPAPLTLRPGQQAVAGLLWRNLVTDPGVVASNGAYLDITPAPGRPRQTIRTVDPIDLGNTGKLALSPWERVVAKP